jgi:hypothetical protein
MLVVLEPAHLMQSIQYIKAKEEYLSFPKA